MCLLSFGTLGLRPATPLQNDSCMHEQCSSPILLFSLLFSCSILPGLLTSLVERLHFLQTKGCVAIVFLKTLLQLLNVTG
jgi:hypothetical protein